MEKKFDIILQVMSFVLQLLLQMMELFMLVVMIRNYINLLFLRPRRLLLLI